MRARAYAPASMAVLTAFDLDDARALGALFGLDVARVTGIPAGSVNSNFRLDLVNGQRLFLRIYEEQGMEAAEREARLLAALAGAGVPTPAPLPRLAEHHGKPVAVFPWRDGGMICQASVTPAHVEALGRAL